MRPAAIAPLVAFAVACIPKADYATAPVPIELTLIVEPEFSPAQVNAIVEAARDWVVATENVIINMRIDSCFESRHVLESDERCVIARSGEEIEETWHLTDSVGVHVGGKEHIIALDKWHLNLRDLRLVAGHEIGHAFGLAHGVQGTVMAVHLEDQVNPNCKDVAALWRVRGGVAAPCRVKGT